MTHDIGSLIGEYGVAMVFANVLVDQIGLPIPAVPTLVIAGALAGDGRLSLAAVFAVSLFACLAADFAWYLAGRFYGNRIMKLLCRVSLTPDSCVSQTEAKFEHWGLRTLVIAKFVPGLALIAPPLAGASRSGWLAFLVFDAIGAALWVGAALGGGMLLQSQIDDVLGRLQDVGAAAGAVVLGILVAYVAWKWWQRRRFYHELRMARISVDELYRMMDAGTAPVVVDVRSPGALSRDPKRIPGAFSLPLDGFDHHVGNLPRDREVVLYCTCPNEASAARVAKLLIDCGFTKVRPLLGGLDAWVAAGYSVEVVSVAGAEVQAGKRADA